MAQRRTDLAVEAHQLWQEGAQDASALDGVRAEEGEQEGFPVTTVTVSTPEAAKALGKPEGVYVTLELDGLLRREEGAFTRAAQAVAGALRPLLRSDGPALVIGLGGDPRPHRPPYPGAPAGHPPPGGADTGALWRSAAGGRRRPRRAGYHRHGEQPCRPGAGRGDETRLRHRSGRAGLSRTVQFSDTGVVPGSGVGNHRAALDQESLGIPVLTVGAPTVVDGATLALDLLEQAGVPAPDRSSLPQGDSFFVTPREVDQRVADLSKVLGYGISLALNPSLTVDDLTMLLE